MLSEEDRLVHDIRRKLQGLVRYHLTSDKLTSDNALVAGELIALLDSFVQAKIEVALKPLIGDM